MKYETFTNDEKYWYTEDDLSAANDYAERTVNGQYPMEITKDRDLRVGASDFLAGIKYLKMKSPDPAPASGQLVEALKKEILKILHSKLTIREVEHGWVIDGTAESCEAILAALANHSEDRDKEMVDLLEWAANNEWGMDSSNLWFVVSKRGSEFYDQKRYTTSELLSLYRKQKQQI